ncbi:MAG: efflux transporter outer membrane subunit, partial [Phycisphaeraceae bacterium]
MGRSLLFLIATGAVVSACTVGPDYEAANLDTPERYAERSWSPVAIDADSAEVKWWETLGDPQLTSLIEQALASSPDLALAEARLREARSLVGVDEAALLPRVGTASEYRRLRLSENLPVLDEFIDRGQIDRDQELFTAGFDASWEIDVFGGSRRSVEAAVRRADASVEQRRAVAVSLVAEVAREYFELRGNQARLAALEEAMAARESLLAWAEDAEQAGLSSRRAIVDATAEVDALASRMPMLRSAVAASAYRIALLTDRPVRETWDRLRERRPLPAAPDAVPVGLPGELLRRHPDVRGAERQLAAATADIGVAVSDLYPKFYLTGQAGLQSSSFGDLFDGGSGAWSIGPAVRWPIFQGGRIRANIDAAEARADAAMVRYHSRVRQAIVDVETALTRYGRAWQRRARLA